MGHNPGHQLTKLGCTQVVCFLVYLVCPAERAVKTGTSGVVIPWPRCLEFEAPSPASRIAEEPAHGALPRVEGTSGWRGGGGGVGVGVGFVFLKWQ